MGGAGFKGGAGFVGGAGLVGGGWLTERCGLLCGTAGFGGGGLGGVR